MPGGSCVWQERRRRLATELAAARKIFSILGDSGVEGVRLGVNEK